MKGFGGIPGNMQSLVKQAQKMQKEIEKAQAEAENMIAEGSAGGGMVKVTVNGKNQIVELLYDDELIKSQDKEMIQDVTKSAVNEALSRVQDKLKEAMSKATGGMNLPGLF